MRSPGSRPHWWQLYLLFPLVIALFALDSRLALSTFGHQAVQIGILLLIFGLANWWLKSNQNGLSRMDRDQYHGTSSAIQVHPAQLPQSNPEHQPLFRIPASGIKGVLGDTFQEESSDSEAIPTDDDRKTTKQV